MWDGGLLGARGKPQQIDVLVCGQTVWVCVGGGILEQPWSGWASVVLMGEQRSE